MVIDRQRAVRIQARNRDVNQADWLDELHSPRRPNCYAVLLQHVIARFVNAHLTVNVVMLRPMRLRLLMNCLDDLNLIEIVVDWPSNYCYDYLNDLDQDVNRNLDASDFVTHCLVQHFVH